MSKNPKETKKGCLRCGGVLPPLDTSGYCRTCIAQLARGDWLEESFVQPEGVEGGLAPDALKTDALRPEDGVEGSEIGPYKLMEKLGEGGFGVVWAAEQRQPIKRRVALKIIKRGMDSRQIIARFEAERQALALMDHPHISKVLDAGTTDSGLPFFVMELVRGIKLTEYCQQERLSVSKRLELFVSVCQALQHSHQKGLIHRDVKPSNILVTLHDGVPIPKVIDFGIAKATQQELTDKTIYTRFAQFIGTPTYMSPEQAEMSGLDIDTRTDIYSLGVLLYELLTGTTPFDSKELLASGIDEMRRMIREREPERPSTRLQRISSLPPAPSKGSQSAPVLSSGDSVIDRDLDWIVVKCLEKDRARRYDTANGLAMDVRRYLSDEPIMARPPSRTYRMSKAWKRNRAAYIAAVLVAGALVLGALTSTWQYFRADEARVTAETARDNENSQRIKAENASELAKKAEMEATRQREAAERQSYISGMMLASKALEENDLWLARTVLDRHRNVAEKEGGWEWRWLWRLTKGTATFELPSHKEAVQAITVSPDGRTIVSTDNGIVRWWDAMTRTLKHERQQNIRGFVHDAVRFSPDGKLLAFASRSDSGLEVEFLDVENDWRAAVTVMMTEEIDDGSQLVASAFSPDSRKFAVLTRRGQVFIADLEEAGKGKEIYRFDPMAAPPFGDIAFSQDGHLFAGLEFRVVKLDVETGEVVQSYSQLTQSVSSIAYSNERGTLAVGQGMSSGAISLFKASDLELTGHLTGHKAWVTELIFLENQSRLMSSSGDQTIRIWDLETFEQVSVLRGHTNEIYSMAVVPGQSILVSGTKDGKLLGWDLEIEGSRLSPNQVIDRRVPSFAVWSAFNSAGREVLLSDGMGSVDLINLRSQAILKSFRVEDFGPLTNGVYGRSGSRIYLGTPRGVVFELSREDFSVIREMAVSHERGVCVPVLESPDESLLWIVDPIKIESFAVDLSTGRVRRDRQVPVQPSGASYSTTKSALLETFEQDAKAYSLNDGSLLFHEKLDRKARGSALSNDMRLLAYTNGQHLSMLNLETGEKQTSIRGQLLGMHSVAFSPDGKRLLTGGSGDVKLWDLETLQPMLTLKGRGNHYFRVGFVADDLIFAVSERKQLLYWYAPTWEELNEDETNRVD